MRRLGSSANSGYSGSTNTLLLIPTTMGKKSTTKKNRPAAKPAKQQQKQVAPTAVQVEQRASILSRSGNASGPVRPVSRQQAGMLDQSEYVRSDIVRIGLLLLVVALVLAICSVAVTKSPRFRQTGQHLASVLRLQ